MSFMSFLDRFTRRGRIGIVVAGVAVCLVAGVALGSWASGARGGRAPAPGASSAGAAAPSRAAPASARPGDSAAAGSSTGVDCGADLPRLGASPFAQTTDPAVFAASVRAGLGYDYTSYQPTDVAAEADRINQEILAGMTPADGPLGAQVHGVLRSAITRATDLDRLEYRIRAHQHDRIDVTAVAVLDNETLHDEVGDAVYRAVISHRQEGIYQYGVTASVTTTMQAVDDTAGWTRTQTSVLHVLVHCPAGGVCTLIGVTGSAEA